MPEAARYSALERLRDGRSVEIRALRRDDQADFISAVGHASAQSLYRRFFIPRRNFSEEEIAFFTDVDFVDHVALVAVMEEAGRRIIVGGSRYVAAEPGRAEVGFVVVDQYQGKGIGSALMRHLVEIARGAGLKELIAEVLSDNAAMLGLFKKSGFRITGRGPGIVYLMSRLC